MNLYTINNNIIKHPGLPISKKAEKAVYIWQGPPYSLKNVLYDSHVCPYTRTSTTRTRPRLILNCVTLNLIARVYNTDCCPCALAAHAHEVQAARYSLICEEIYALCDFLRILENNKTVIKSLFTLINYKLKIPWV